MKNLKAKNFQSLQFYNYQQRNPSKQVLVCFLEKVCDFYLNLVLVCILSKLKVIY